MFRSADSRRRRLNAFTVIVTAETETIVCFGVVVLCGLWVPVGSVVSNVWAKAYTFLIPLRGQGLCCFGVVFSLETGFVLLYHVLFRGFRRRWRVTSYLCVVPSRQEPKSSLCCVVLCCEQIFGV